MAYENLKKITHRLCLDSDQVRDIVEAYADDLEADEPYAVDDIEAAKTTADGIRDALNS